MVTGKTRGDERCGCGRGGEEGVDVWEAARYVEGKHCLRQEYCFRRRLASKQDLRFVARGRQRGAKVVIMLL